MSDNFEGIKVALVKNDEQKVLTLVEERLKAGQDPHEITNALGQALEQVGELFEKGEIYIPEMIRAADIFSSASEKIEPYLNHKNDSSRSLGKFMIATVYGDLHDLGKNLVSMMLRYSRFNVIDLGKDVPTEKIVDAIKFHKPNILGLSALLTTTMKMQAEVINALKAEGLRDSLKVILGGAPVDQEWADVIGADAYAEDAVAAVRISKQLLADRGMK